MLRKEKEEAKFKESKKNKKMVNDNETNEHSTFFSFAHLINPNKTKSKEIR